MNHDAWNLGFDAFFDAGGDEDVWIKTLGVGNWVTGPDCFFNGWLDAQAYCDSMKETADD